MAAGMSVGNIVGNIGGNIGMSHFSPIPKDPLTFEILLHDKTHKAGTVSFDEMLYRLNALKVSAGTSVNGEVGKHINIYV